MILVTFKSDDGLRMGVKTETGIFDIEMALRHRSSDPVTGIPHRLDDLLAGGSPNLKALKRFVNETNREDPGAPWILNENDIELGPCLPNPGKIICVGLNYRRHAAEAGMQIPENPILFSKFTNAIAAPGESIPLPANAEQYDYEAELAVVIAEQTRYVSETEALSHVFGYCNANDLSARDLQFRTNQWLLGKTLDKFMPVGPYLVTVDEVDDPQALTIRCWVNGNLRQNSNTADMIFSVAQLVSYISQYMTLEPGDLISTGTPEGVIFGTSERQWLKPGDQVSVEIEGLGRLTNAMGMG